MSSPFDDLDHTMIRATFSFDRDFKTRGLRMDLNQILDPKLGLSISKEEIEWAIGNMAFSPSVDGYGDLMSRRRRRAMEVEHFFKKCAEAMIAEIEKDEPWDELMAELVEHGRRFRKGMFALSAKKKETPTNE